MSESAQDPQRITYSADAEVAVLGAIMLWPDAMDRVGDLEPEDFYIGLHAQAFRVLRRLYDQGKALDMLSVSEAGGLPLTKLGEICQATPSAHNVARYAEIVREFGIARRLISAANRISEFAATRGPATEKMDRALALIDEIAERGIRKAFEPRPLLDVLSRTMDMVDHRYTRGPGLDGLPTGLVDLDQELNGLRPGQLVYIAGRPAMGKTTLALQIATHVAPITPVLVASMEMSGEEVGEKVIANLGHVPITRLRTGQLQDEHWNRITTAVARAIDFRMVVDDQPALTVYDLRAKARKARRRLGSLGLIVVDYLQLMSAKGDNRNAQIEQISRGLKAIAKEMRCPLICLSQLSRDCEKRTNKRPMLSDLRDSGSIEQDADVVIFVYRDEAYNADSPNRGTAELLIAKQRMGSTGMVRAVFQGQFSRFDNYGGAPGDSPPPMAAARRGQFADADPAVQRGAPVQ